MVGLASLSALCRSQPVCYVTGRNYKFETNSELLLTEGVQIV